MLNNYKLTIELVPSTSWYSNVRSNVTKSEWDTIRKKSYDLADNKCEICGSTGLKQGYKHRVECHEVWHYNDLLEIQTLTRLISLCPNCHKSKHVGLARIKNQEHIVINQLSTINNISTTEAINYINESFNIWQQRSSKNWELDITYLDEYLKKDLLFGDF
jgi:hypothetical protein